MLPFRAARHASFWWAAFVILAAVEFFLFDRFGSRHHTWVYPRWNDQIQYLSECYTGYENARVVGLMRGLYDTLVNRSAQGTLHDFWAVLLFQFTGPSRSAALSLNFLAFLGWQFAVFAQALRSTRSGALALVGAALVLAVRSPWEVSPGSAFDFRLDWFAAAAMGLALVSAQATDGFRRTGASSGFGLAVALTLLTRFLTGAYFVLIFLAFAAWAITGPNRLRRIANLFLAAGIAAALAGPIFWINRSVVYDYYLIGHFVGPESALRSPHMGLWRSTDWLVSHLREMHLGNWFLFYSATLLIAGAVALLVWPRKPSEENFQIGEARRSWVPALAFLLGPAVILILHVQKSEYVLGVMVPACVALVFEFVRRPLHAVSGPALQRFAACATLASLFVFAQRMIQNPHPPEFVALARHVNTLADYIAKRSAATHLPSTRVAVDRVTDCLDAQVLRVICYERQHQFIPFIMTLPTGIQREDPKLYWERLRNSDLVFLTEDGNAGPWPYDQQLAAMRPETLSWARSNLKPVDEIQLAECRLALFERQDLTK